jgi:hypothetical protein
LQGLGGGKNAQKTRYYGLRGPPQKQFYSGLGKVRALFYFEGSITAFKGTIRKIIELLAVFS